MPLTLLENSWKHSQLIIKQSKTFKSFIFIVICVYMSVTVNEYTQYAWVPPEVRRWLQAP